MDYNSLIIYFSALLLGCITIFTAYFLHKTYKLPYLSDYVYFLLLANIWGFFIWIAPDLLKIFESDGQGPFVSYKMISVVKWFGFPFHLLQLYFLVRILWGMMDLPVRRLFKNTYILFSILLISLVIIATLKMLNSEEIFYSFYFIAVVITNLYMFFQFLVFFYAFSISRKISRKTMGKNYRNFILFYLLSFSFYFFFSKTRFTPAVIISILYYGYHLPPLIYLYSFSQSLVRRQTLGELSVETLNTFFSKYRLSVREKEIVQLLLSGKSNRDIEKELYISLQTVKNYVSRIYKKLGTRNRIELFNLYRNLTKS